MAYASRQELFLSIGKRYGKSSDQPAQAQQASTTQRRAPRSAMGLYSEDTKAMSYFGSVYADQDLSHRARTVYMYLKDRSNVGDTCWPSVRRIAEDLKLSRRTVQRALTDLERHGFLERTHRRRPNGSLTSNLYRVK